MFPEFTWVRPVAGRTLSKTTPKGIEGTPGEVKVKLEAVPPLLDDSLIVGGLGKKLKVSYKKLTSSTLSVLLVEFLIIRTD